MKKFTYIFLLASCLLLASCESWLDEDPQYTLNTQIQFSTSEKARAALYGCYGYFALTSGGYGQHWQEIRYDIVVSDGHRLMGVQMICVDGCNVTIQMIC
ncbi:hypothetical protein NXX35_25110 [Bacteroides xylanisolvens]|nr:hypothetical protein NXX35_25110 [Bacteroides xylanisolvens]